MTTLDTEKKITKGPLLSPIDKNILQIKQDWFKKLDASSLAIFETSDTSVENPAKDTSSSNLKKDSSSEPIEIDFSTGLSCQICKVESFSTLSAQREHFRLDWHRINLQCKIKGLLPITEEIYEEFLENLSIKSDDSVDEFQLIISQLGLSDDLIEKNKELELIENEKDKTLDTSPIHWFKLQDEKSKLVGIYRSLLTGLNSNDKPSSVETIIKQHKNSLWAFIMLGGGYFAAAIIDNAKFDFKNNKPCIVAHKCFKRYTVRRKQGGAQSGNDNSKGKAKSAGAHIRRQMEALLRTDMKDLFISWKQHFDSCSRVFFRASGNNHKTLFDIETIPFSSQEPRVQSIPFTTKRPTLKEINKCYLELIQIKSKQIKEPAIVSSENTNKPFLTTKVPSLSLEDRVQKIAISSPKETKQVSEKSELVSSNRFEYSPKSSSVPDAFALDLIDQLVTWLETTDPLLSSYDSNQFTVKLEASSFLQNEPNFKIPGLKNFPTILHLACIHGHSALIHKLLDLGCDPSLTIGEDSLTAFQLSKTKTTKMQFRLYRFEYPDRFDWELARVPPAISPIDHKNKVELQRSKQKAKSLKKTTNILQAPPTASINTPQEPSVIFRSLAGGFKLTSNNSNVLGSGFGSLRSTNSSSNTGFGFFKTSGFGENTKPKSNLGFSFGNSQNTNN